jgi:hypothetical protein
MEKSAQRNPRLIAYVEEQQHVKAVSIKASQKKESAILWIFLFVPRVIKTSVLFAGFIGFVPVVILLYCLWAPTVLVNGPSRFRNYSTRLSQKFGAGFAWFGRQFRATW